VAAISYDKNVFINCPFDDDYKPLFDAVVFAVHDCGFRVRCALEEEDSGEVRVSKLYKIISECRLSIHDISRTEVSKDSKLPRFNMPLELGVFLGARAYGSGRQKQKRCLILDRERYRYQRYISDLAGQDPKAHADDPAKAIQCVRDWLSHHGNKRVTLPGPAAMVGRYNRFNRQLPAILKEAGIKPKELIYNDYTTFVVAWLKENPWG
jgi:hypothetical protein